MEDVLNDLVAEYDRLERILSSLDDEQWLAPSGAPGWTVRDVVVHLAQTEEAVAVSLAEPVAEWTSRDRPLDDAVDARVRADTTPAGEVLERWRSARRASVTALAIADPDVIVRWAAAPLKPKTLATTRLAEHWAHGLDICEPLGLEPGGHRSAAPHRLVGSCDLAVRSAACRARPARVAVHARGSRRCALDLRPAIRVTLGHRVRRGVLQSWRETARRRRVRTRRVGTGRSRSPWRASQLRRLTHRRVPERVWAATPPVDRPGESRTHRGPGSVYAGTCDGSTRYNQRVESRAFSPRTESRRR